MWQMRSQQMLVGNLIKFYLVSYYAYRFLTEFIRPEPIVLFDLTFYQLVSLFGIALFGTLWYRDHKQIAALLAHEKLAAQE
jgi:phosphatidylglycerol:prolipoprotein diacylglycerol transferase